MIKKIIKIQSGRISFFLIILEIICKIVLSKPNLGVRLFWDYNGNINICTKIILLKINCLNNQKPIIDDELLSLMIFRWLEYFQKIVLFIDKTKTFPVKKKKYSFNYEAMTSTSDS